MASNWEDGSFVVFTDEAKAIFQSGTWEDRKSRPDQVYSIVNVEGTFHDVLFSENRERWGVQWLTAIDQEVREAYRDLVAARKTLAHLRNAQQAREDARTALLAAHQSAIAISRFREFGVTGSADVAATLNLLDVPISTDITIWESVCLKYAEKWLREKRQFEKAWPTYVGKIQQPHHEH